VWQSAVQTREPTSSPLSDGDETEVDDANGPPENNGVTVTTVATTSESHPAWHVETNLVFTGTKVKLFKQTNILRAIFHESFDNVRKDLILKHAFPDPIAMPCMLRKCLVDAARKHTMIDGHYNVSAAHIHQRILSDVVYEANMIRLVSGFTSTTTRLIIHSAACTHPHLPRVCQGAMC
jgi:hypothetical protein